MTNAKLRAADAGQPSIIKLTAIAINSPIRHIRGIFALIGAGAMGWIIAKPLSKKIVNGLDAFAIKIKNRTNRGGLDG